MILSESVPEDELEKVVKFFDEFHPGFHFYLRIAKVEKRETDKGVRYTFKWTNVFDFTDFFDLAISLMRENKNFRRLSVRRDIVVPELYYSVCVEIPKSVLRKVMS